MTEHLIKFAIGGIVVSLFAVFGDVLKPKSFAGITAAAPSVALASLAMAVSKHGAEYGATEARSMMIGAAALLIYSHITAWILMRTSCHALLAALGSLAAWFAVALGGLALLQGGLPR
jgi:hypothetical protein